MDIWITRFSPIGTDMKVGVFITGHFRDAPITKQNYSQFLDSSHEVKFYVATWSNYDINRQTHNIIDMKLPVSDMLYNVFEDRLGGAWIGNIEDFYTGDLFHPVDRPDWKPITHYLSRSEAQPHIAVDDNWPFLSRLYDQTYVWHQCYLLAKDEWDSFDVCLRIRGDMDFRGKEKIPIEENQDGIHVNSYWWTPYSNEDSTGLSPHKISDHMGWGKPMYMKKYFDYHNNLVTLAQWATKQPHHVFQHNFEHWFAFYLLRFPYIKPYLDPNDINDHDLEIYKHGNLQRVLNHAAGGRSEYEFYAIVDKNLR